MSRVRPVLITFLLACSHVANGQTPPAAPPVPAQNSSSPSLPTQTAPTLRLAVADFAGVPNFDAASGSSNVAAPSPDLFIGGISASLPLEIPSGRHGLKPQMQLTYRNTNPDGWLGMGWNFDLGSIQRKSQNGLDYQGNAFVYQIGGSSVDLIQIGNGEYRAKIEGTFIRIRKLIATDGQDYWELTDKTGQHSLFGQSIESRLVDPANGGHVYQWYLDRIEDTFSNFILVKHTKDQQAVYISEIDYAGHNDMAPSSQVLFIGENRMDAETGYQTNFSVTTAKRLKAIEIIANGSVMRAYSLKYEYSPSSGRSLLTSVQTFGRNAVFSPSGDVAKGTGLQPEVFTWYADLQSFQAPTTSGNLDWGYADGRWWADVDGDGKADYCRTVGSVNNQSSHISCTLSTGAGFGQTITSGVVDWGLPQGRAWVDVNGDGKADYCRLIGNVNNQSSYISCTLSTGTGFGQTITSGVVDWGYADGRAWVDENGDGKADYCRTVGSVNNQSSLISCTLSTGNGFGQTITSGVVDWGYPDGRAWVDVNGDGKADYCRTVGNVNNQSSYISCTLSTGTGFGQTITSSVVDWGLPEGRAWADFSGTGRPAYCRLVGTAPNNKYVQITPVSGFSADALKSITNELGGTTTLHYTPSTQYANTQLPFSLPTLSSIDLADGLGHLTTTNYSYAGGYYSFTAREFRGFNTAVVTGPRDANGQQQIQHIQFHQGNDVTVDANSPGVEVAYTKGKQYRTQTYDGQGNLFEEVTTSYAPGATEPFYNPVSEVDTTVCDGADCDKHYKVTYEYDQYGNLTKEQNLGDLSTPTDDRTIIRQYSPNTSAWIVALVASEAVYSGTDQLHQVSGSDFYYDGVRTCNDVSNNKTPTMGSLTRVVPWMPDARQVDTRMAYDDFGNLICKRDSIGNIIQFTYDFTKTFLLTATTPKFTTRTTYYGIDSQSTGSGNYGEVKDEVDENGVARTTEYDQLGRRVRQGTANDLMWSKWSYVAIGFPGSQNITEESSIGLTHSKYFDGLQRITSETERGPDQNTIIVESEYDGRGLLRKVSTPHFQSETNKGYKSFTYDAVGRMLETSFPDGSSRLQCYHGDVSVSVDQNHHRKRETRDVHGRILKEEEYRGFFLQSCSTDETPDVTPAELQEFVKVFPNQTLPVKHMPYSATSYTYDVLGNLTSSVDSKGNTASIFYDSLNRKTMVNDPDLGVWKYEYDLNGNLIKQTDALKQTTFLQYDSLNRVAQRDYGRKKALGSGDVVYTYDGGGIYGRNRLTSVRNKSALVGYGYDALGRSTQITRAYPHIA